jgi:hypothetical protein
MPATPNDAELLRQLDQLEAESAARRAELRRLSTVLPHAVSRRSMLKSIIADMRSAPDRPMIVGRLARKLLRVPAGVLRRFGRRFGSAR